MNPFVEAVSDLLKEALILPKVGPAGGRLAAAKQVVMKATPVPMPRRGGPVNVPGQSPARRALGVQRTPPVPAPAPAAKWEPRVYTGDPSKIVKTLPPATPRDPSLYAQTSALPGADVIRGAPGVSGAMTRLKGVRAGIPGPRSGGMVPYAPPPPRIAPGHAPYQPPAATSPKTPEIVGSVKRPPPAGGPGSAGAEGKVVDVPFTVKEPPAPTPSTPQTNPWAAFGAGAGAGLVGAALLRPRRERKAAMDPFVQGFVDELEKDGGRAANIAASVLFAIPTLGYMTREAVKRAPRVAREAPAITRIVREPVRPSIATPATVRKPAGTIVGTGGTGVSVEAAEEAKRLAQTRKAWEAAEKAEKSFVGPRLPR